MKIGVLAEGFRCPLPEAFEKIAGLGLSGVQIYVTRGEFTPQLLKDKPALDNYLKQLKDLGLTISAFCGDMGGYGFEIENDNAERIEKTKAIIDLATVCGTSVVTTHIGVIPEDEKEERFNIMLKAMDTLGLYAKKQGITLAIETGPETPETLLKFIEQTHGGVGVNMDPANLVMVTGADPVKAVKILGKHIVHTHVKDGIMKKKTDPAYIYNIFAEGGIEDVRMSDYFIETPVGEGNVDFSNYLKALNETGYNGFHTIEREAGDDPAKDIGLAAEYIRKKLKEAGY